MVIGPSVRGRADSCRSSRFNSGNVSVMRKTPAPCTKDAECTAGNAGSTPSLDRFWPRLILTGQDTGPSTRRCEFEPRRGYFMFLKQCQITRTQIDADWTLVEYRHPAGLYASYRQHRLHDPVIYEEPVEKWLQRNIHGHFHCESAALCDAASRPSTQPQSPKMKATYSLVAIARPDSACAKARGNGTIHRRRTMEVRLSRRNLLTLLAKLDIPGSHCTLIKPDGTVVVAEPDEVHYANRPRPGQMSEETEARVAGIAAALASLKEFWLAVEAEIAIEGAADRLAAKVRQKWAEQGTRQPTPR